MATGALAHSVDRLRTDLVRFLGGHIDDDTTLLLLQPAGTGREAAAMAGARDLPTGR